MLNFSVFTAARGIAILSSGFVAIESVHETHCRDFTDCHSVRVQCGVRSRNLGYMYCQNICYSRSVVRVEAKPLHEFGIDVVWAYRMMCERRQTVLS